MMSTLLMSLLLVACAASPTPFPTPLPPTTVAFSRPQQAPHDCEDRIEGGADPGVMTPQRICPQEPGQPLVLTVTARTMKSCRVVPVIKLRLQQGACREQLASNTGQLQLLTSVTSDNQLIKGEIKVVYGPGLSLTMPFSSNLTGEIRNGIDVPVEEMEGPLDFGLVFTVPEAQDELAFRRWGQGRSGGGVEPQVRSSRKKRSPLRYYSDGRARGGEKRVWENSGMQWIRKRNPDRRYSATDLDYDPDERIREIFEEVFSNYGDEEAMKDDGSEDYPYIAWLKKNSRKKRSLEEEEGGEKEEEEKKASWANSGMQWIKRHDAEKKNWANSGMQWIKRDQEESDKRGSWANSGMQWIRKKATEGDPEPSKVEPQAAANSAAIGRLFPGMSRLQAEKTNRPQAEAMNGPQATNGWQQKRGSWEKSGMKWIRSNGAWKNSGMRWIRSHD